MNRLIQWFVENPVAANLVMIVIFIGGLVSALGDGVLNKEVFPTATSKYVEVSMSYPGAGPKEVEEQIAIRIEEAIADIDGIDEIASESRQGLGRVTAEVEEGYNPDLILQEIKAEVDAINSFPDNVERPVTKKFIGRSPLMSLALFGDIDEAALKSVGNQVRDELALLDGVSQVELQATRAGEMAIEISEVNLRRYNLSFDQVASAIRGASLNLPAGSIRTNRGDIQVQTRAQGYVASDFARIVVVSNPDGSKLYLEDVATITDGFAEDNIRARFDGQPAIFLELSVTDRPDILKSVNEVKKYLKNSEQFLPASVELAVWRDWSVTFNGRLNLLMGNAFTGLILVFVVLMLFLRPLLAIWVCIGIATAFLGALWLLPATGVSINMISLFAFLLVLGIVVDDAIIVGESIYSRNQEGIRGAAGSAGGAKLVAKPVFFAVISTMIFFAPLLFVPGFTGTMSYPIPVVVILALAFSLIECLFILPSHLKNMPEEKPSRFVPLQKLAELRKRFADGLAQVANNYYKPLLERGLRQKNATVVGFGLAFLLSLAVYAGGWLKSSFLPIVPSDFVEAKVTMPEGTAFAKTQAVLTRIENAALALRNDPDLRAKNSGADFIQHVQTNARETSITMGLALANAEVRDVSTPEVSKRWTELVGEIPEAESFRIDYTINSRGEAFRLNLSVASDDQATQEEITRQVTQALSAYPGVYNVKSTLQAARTEVELALKPNAEALGLSLSDIARQVRQGFYGEEVQRIPRSEEDVKVMVRYPLAERTNLDQLNRMRVRSPDGLEIPLEEVATISMVPGYTKIKRIDRKRNIAITAELETGYSNTEILDDLRTRYQDQWRRDFPGFSLDVGGNIKSRGEFMSSLQRNFGFALLAIYCLMAIAFGSYGQPLLVLTAVPFGFMGAVIGHAIMSREISMLSILGFVACAGVVVNDNLVLLDRINQLRQQGLKAFDAVLQAGVDRFRPIVLTSLTTFIGLVPIMMEPSVQAQFLIPMVISLSFGVLFATTVTLGLVPALYLLGHRIGTRFNNFKAKLLTNGVPSE